MKQVNREHRLGSKLNLSPMLKPNRIVKCKVAHEKKGKEKSVTITNKKKQRIQE